VRNNNHDALAGLHTEDRAGESFISIGVEI